MIADPDGIYDQLLHERFGPLWALEAEQWRRPLPMPAQIHRRRRPLLADDETWRDA